MMSLSRGSAGLILALSMSLSSGPALAQPFGDTSPTLAGLAAASAPAGRAVDRSPPTPTFRGGVDLVTLDVCIKGRDGQFVPEVSPDEFLILEDNIPQRLAFFSTEGHVPLATVLVIDRSQSMWGAKLARAQAAAAQFLTMSRPDDQVEVLAFNQLASRLFPLGSDHLAAAQTLSRLSAIGATGLYEAVLVALDDLRRAERGSSIEHRKAVVVLSDGEDTSSRLSFEEVLEEARRSGVLIYAISLRTDEDDHWLPPLRQLSQLAFDTGGQAVAVRDLATLPATYEAIGAELHHLYRLAYVPVSSRHDGRWRKVSVRVLNKDLSVRTRSGYYAPRPAVNLPRPQP